MNIILSLIVALNLIAPGQQKMKFTVSNDAATILVPIIHKNEFIWYADKTPDSALEYSCMIKVESYEFGYSLFKGGDRQERGSIFDLFKKGQVDLWKIDKDGGEVLDKYQVLVFYKQPHIVIQIKDKEALKLLFANKPQNFSLQVFGFKTGAHAPKLEIEYKD